MNDARRVGKALRRRLESTVRRVMLGVHAELLHATPVDTGWARTNWVPNVGAPFEGTAGSREAAEAGRLDRAPQEAGVAALRDYRLEQGDVHDTNNVPYIQLLNAGSSRQAPPAFVQASIVRGIERSGARRTQ